MKMMKTRNIGWGISSEKADEGDKKSPFSGAVRVHGRTFIGVVIAARMQKTATVEWIRTVRIPKYERYMKKRTKVKAHNPDSIRAEEGDVVRIIETRPLSKTKNFVIVEKMGKQKEYAQRKEALTESKAGRVEEENESD